MQALRFEVASPAVASHPNRTDIACFVGFVALRDPSEDGDRLAAARERVLAFLEEQSWITRSGRGKVVIRGLHGRSPSDVDRLLDLPIPVDSWEDFHRLFAWDRRMLEDAGPRACTWLGAAVRSYFAEGGRKCYV